MIDIGSAEGGRGVPLVLKSGGQTVVKLEGADHSLRRQTPETLKLGYEGQRVAADISRETWEMNLKLAGEIKAFMEKAAGGKGK
jgi:hypothetical protein